MCIVVLSPLNFDFELKTICMIAPGAAQLIHSWVDCYSSYVICAVDQRLTLVEMHFDILHSLQLVWRSDCSIF